MQSLSVRRPCQGGKIRGTVSYTIYDGARGLADCCNAREKTRAVARLELGACRASLLVHVAVQQFQQFETARLQSVRELALAVLRVGQLLRVEAQ
jgi:hypothetical protein